MNAVLRLFIALFLIYLLQSFFSVFQIRAYQRALRESRSLGTIGVGQKKAKFGIIKGNIVIIGCDRQGLITGGQIMEGITLFARFKPLKEIIKGRPLQEGETIYDYLSELRSMTKKEQDYYQGYIRALEAIEMRFEHEAEEALAVEVNAREDAELDGDFDIDAL